MYEVKKQQILGSKINCKGSKTHGITRTDGVTWLQFTATWGFVQSPQFPGTCSFMNSNHFSVTAVWCILCSTILLPFLVCTLASVKWLWSSAHATALENDIVSQSQVVQLAVNERPRAKVALGFPHYHKRSTQFSSPQCWTHLCICSASSGVSRDHSPGSHNIKCWTKWIHRMLEKLSTVCSTQTAYHLKENVHPGRQSMQ